MQGSKLYSLSYRVWLGTFPNWSCAHSTLHYSGGIAGIQFQHDVYWLRQRGKISIIPTNQVIQSELLYGFDLFLRDLTPSSALHCIFFRFANLCLYFHRECIRKGFAVFSFYLRVTGAAISSSVVSVQCTDHDIADCEHVFSYFASPVLFYFIFSSFRSTVLILCVTGMCFSVHHLNIACRTATESSSPLSFLIPHSHVAIVGIFLFISSFCNLFSFSNMKTTLSIYWQFPAMARSACNRLIFIYRNV